MQATSPRKQRPSASPDSLPALLRQSPDPFSQRWRRLELLITGAVLAADHRERDLLYQLRPLILEPESCGAPCVGQWLLARRPSP